MAATDTEHGKIFARRLSCLARYTQNTSSEFAVRPFIIKHEKRMMAQMHTWSKHDNEHIRRLASEGCRPALPWSIALAKDWYGKNEHTDWIVKHGCRTLLKKGNRDALSIFGYADTVSIEVEGFSLETDSIFIGEDIAFSFSITAAEETKVRLEYGIDYVKANGKRNRKIFQISEVVLKRNVRKSYTKNHSFADLSTRKHYPGIHSVTLFVNGAERGKLDFALRMP